MDRIGEVVDHPRQAGIRGGVAEHTHDEDFTYLEGHPPDPPSPSLTPRLQAVGKSWSDPSLRDGELEMPGCQVLRCCWANARRSVSG